MQILDIYKLTITKGPLKGESFDISPGVTFLVGKNGAGKSQILEAIKLGYCSVQHRVNKHNHLNQYTAVVWGEKPYEDEIGRKKDHNDLKALLKETAQIEIEKKEDMILKKEERNSDGDKEEFYIKTTTHTLNGELFRSDMMSSGTKTLYEKFAWKLKDGKPYPETRKHNMHQITAWFALWDEPEQFLHPSEQKKIPERIDKWLTETLRILPRKRANTPPVFVVVATHSPFALAGIQNRKDHNVICLDKCKVVSGGKKSLSEIRMEANELLGAGIQDMLPGKMILTEGSIEVLLREIANKFDFDLEKFIVTANGDGNLKKRINRLSEIIKILAQLSKSWPERHFFKFEILAVVDDKKIKKEIDDYKTSELLSVDTFALGEIQLEDIYPLEWVNNFLGIEEKLEAHWDGEELISKFLYTSCGIEDKHQGAFKARLAEYIALQIKSKDDLKQYLPIVDTFFTHQEEVGSDTV